MECISTLSQRVKDLKTDIKLQVALMGLALMLSGGSAAQHAMHSQPADITGIAAKTETIPNDDSVLDLAPNELRFAFPSQVRLVKLTLRNESRDWIDISFRYDPEAADRFEWDLPVLPMATYYTADWAILSENDQLVRGSFSFAFGPRAEPPSLTREAEEMLMQMRHGDPSIREVASPRTQIIIDRDPPTFDPPFTIDLDEQGLNPNQ